MELSGPARIKEIEKDINQEIFDQIKKWISLNIISLYGLHYIKDVRKKFS